MNEDYKTVFLQYVKSGIGYCKDDEKIEGFYRFMDEVEAAAEQDNQLYEILADCYMQLRNPKKAKEAFLKCYDANNKKHIKKLLDYDRVRANPITRPGKRAKRLPEFPYVSAGAAKDKFVSNDTEKCMLCDKKQVPLYIGQAYREESVLFYEQETKRFCADCLKSGRAAEELRVTFQPKLIKEHAGIAISRRNTVLEKTPACAYEFERFCEEVWPVCCEDYCVYEGKGDYEFHFACAHCKKAVTLNEDCVSEQITN